ncbi:MAG: helix-hairpin-helix domain-containing protein [Caldilineaceae bacterium]
MSNTNGEQTKEKVLNNEEIATTLERIAELLDAQHANPYRVQAYREGASTIRHLPEPAHRILERDGVEGLQELPNIGISLARSIQTLIENGKISLLERLQGEIRPERVLSTITGIGPKLAERIHEELGIETLFELENAAYDGRLEKVEGFGAGRLRGIRESLAGRLHRRSPQVERPRPQPSNAPPVGELLEVDAEYRKKLRSLPRISPRRFNPTREAWLPVLHTERGTNHYTVLFSNTARAHELGATHDWVVIYRDDRDGDGQWTIVTSQFGPLKGKRIIRGREKECTDYYAQATVVTTKSDK